MSDLQGGSRAIGEEHFNDTARPQKRQGPSERRKACDVSPLYGAVLIGSVRSSDQGVARKALTLL